MKLRPLSCLALAYTLLGGLAAQPNSSDLREYMARSLVLNNLFAFNDMVHIGAAPKSDASLELLSPYRESDLFTKDCTIELALFDNAKFASRYAAQKAQDVIFNLERDLNLMTVLHEPFFFQSLQFSDLYEKNGVQRIDVTGMLNFAAEFLNEDKGIEKVFPGPFHATYEVSFVPAANTCLMKQFKAARSPDDLPTMHGRSNFEPWSLHTPTFLDPYASPLSTAGSGLCSPEQLERIVRPMLKWQIEYDFESGTKKDTRTNFTQATDLRNRTTYYSTELFQSLPFYLPKKTPNTSIFRGDIEIRELLTMLEKDPDGVPSKVTSVKNKYNQSNDPLNIQAHLVGAWYYTLLEENLPKALQNLEGAENCPVIKEIYLIRFLAQAKAGHYSEALASMARYRILNGQAVMSEYLTNKYALPWFDHGREMHFVNSHKEAMKGYFIGAMLAPTPERLETLAEKSERLGYLAIAQACYTQMLKEGSAPDPSATWLELAMVQGALGQDPSMAIAQAETPDGEEKAKAYAARATYLNTIAQSSEAQKQVTAGLKRWKNNPDLFEIQGLISKDATKQRKYWLKCLNRSRSTSGTKLFKSGFIRQWIADTDSTTLSDNKRKNFYNTAILDFKKAEKKNYQKALVDRKIARCYIMIDDMDEAANYYALANTNGSSDASVYLARAILDICRNKLGSVADNLTKAQDNGIEPMLDTQGKELLEFLWVLADANQAMELLRYQASDDRSKHDQVERLLADITARASRLQIGEEPGKAYAAFGRMLVACIQGYNDRDPHDKKGFKGTPLEAREVIGNMQAHSHIAPYFFKDNELIKVLRGWNDQLDNEVYPALKHSPKVKNCTYLREADLFKDEYYYL